MGGADDAASNGGHVISKELLKLAKAILYAEVATSCLKWSAPLTLPSIANASGSWRKHAERYKQQRGLGEMLTKTAHGHRELAEALFYEGRAIVAMTRVAPRMLDSDNLTACTKHVRDGIADALGVNDRSERVTWLPTQQRSGQASVEVEIWLW